MLIKSNTDFPLGMQPYELDWFQYAPSFPKLLLFGPELDSNTTKTSCVILQIQLTNHYHVYLVSIKRLRVTTAKMFFFFPMKKILKALPKEVHRNNAPSNYIKDFLK